MNLWTSAVLGAAILAVASAQFTSGMGPAMGPAPASARPLSPAQGRPTTLAPAPAMAPAPAAEPGADPAPAPAMPPAPESCVPPPPPPPASGACACGAAQPISIQLSCGGGGNRRPGGPRPRPPPPPQEFTTWSPMDTTAYYDGGWGQQTTPGSPFDGYDMNNFCTFDVNGYPDPAYTPPGGFPSGFRVTHNSDGSPQIQVGPGEQRPPPHWDGSPATLGFPMPPMGTPTGNMLMCWPIPVATGRK